jgi:hypothetical protein
MSTRRMDSSTLTQMRQARALYSYNASRAAALQTGATVRTEQPTGQWAGIVAQRNLGGPSATFNQGIVEKGCACAGFNVQSALGYPANDTRE